MILKIYQYTTKFLTTVLLLIALFIAISSVNIPGGYKIFSVVTGSMEPSIKTGSVVLVHPQSNYRSGDVITFKSNLEDKTLQNTVTHRLNKIDRVNNIDNYITKGDANQVLDQFPISKDQIIGKVLFSLPLLGYLVSYSKTIQGLVLLIIIPTIIIIFSEIQTLKTEAKRLILERKKRKLSATEKIEEKIGEEIIEVEKDIQNIVHPKHKKHSKNGKNK